MINSIVDITASCMETMFLLGDDRPSWIGQPDGLKGVQSVHPCTLDNSQTYTAVFTSSYRHARGPKSTALIQRLKIQETPEVFNIIAWAFFRPLRLFLNKPNI